MVVLSNPLWIVRTRRISAETPLPVRCPVPILHPGWQASQCLEADRLRTL